MFGTVIPYCLTPKAPAQLNGVRDFLVMDDLKLKLERGQVSQAYVDGWRNLGVQQRPAVVRYVDGLPTVFVIGKSGQEVRAGVARSRHVARACMLNGDLPMTLQSNSPFSLKASYTAATPWTCPVQVPAERAKVSVEERSTRWVETDRRVAEVTK
jgi:hypothetical protein